MRETLDVDILIVGGGPAGLSAALRLAQLQQAAWRRAARRSPFWKRRARLARTCSPGALLDPSTLRDLIPDFKEKGAPLASEVSDDARLLPDATAEARVSDHSAAARRITATTSSRSTSSSVAGGAGRSRGHRFLHGLCRPGRADGRRARRRRAHRRPRHRQARPAEGRRSSLASTSARRSRSSATACAAT